MGDTKEELDDKTNDKKKITLISFIEDHLALLTTISSLIGLILTGLFKCFPYFYEKGYFVFWNIPLKYMKVDYTNTLMQFFLNVAGFIIIIGLALLYMEFYNASKILGRIFLHLILFFINAVVWVYAIFSVGGTISDAVNFTNGETINYFIKVEIFLYLIEVPSIHFFKNKMPKKEKFNKIKFQKGMKLKKQSSRSNNNADKKSLNNQSEHVDKESNKKNGSNKILKNGIGIYLFIIIAYFVGVIWFTCISLGNDRKEACGKTNKFEIVHDESNQEYVILSTHDGLYFVKPCTVYEDQHFIAINTDKYKLLDIKDLEVIIYDFNKYVNVFKLYDNEDYNTYLKQNIVTK